MAIRLEMLETEKKRVASLFSNDFQSQRVKQYTIKQRWSETTSIQWCSQPVHDVSSSSTAGFGEGLPLHPECSLLPSWGRFPWHGHETLLGTTEQYRLPSLIATISLSRLDEGYVFIHYMSHESLSVTLKMFR